MHKYVKRIMKEHVAPIIDDMLDSKKGISPADFKRACDMTYLAKEILEVDMMMDKAGMKEDDRDGKGPYKEDRRVSL